VPYVEGMEVKGHLAARQATRALALMRLSWGWYLNNPFGSNSTMIEGYLQDGTFGYRTGDGGYQNDKSYASHAHGWSTGPTHALSTYVVGLQLLSPGGATWMLAPQFGDLTSVEGGFTTNLGTFSAKWALTSNGYSLNYNMPNSTSGTLVLPATGVPSIILDGSAYAAGLYNASTGLVTLGNQAGGTHSLSVVVSASTSTGAGSAATTTASKKNSGGGFFENLSSLYFLISVASFLVLS
jgi:hypothetical protein